MMGRQWHQFDHMQIIYTLHSVASYFQLYVLLPHIYGS